MKNVTTVFAIKSENHVCLARRKGLFNGKSGYYNGYGGHVENYDESIVDCAVREFCEESGATVKKSSLQPVAVIDFFELRRGELCRNHVFLAQEWSGDLIETEEMGPPELFSKSKLPSENMYPADILWLPLVFNGCIVVSGSSIVYKSGREVVHQHDLRFKFAREIDLSTKIIS